MKAMTKAETKRMLSEWWTKRILDGTTIPSDIISLTSVVQAALELLPDDDSETEQA